MTAVCGDHGRIPGCGAPIIWAKTAAGQAVPLDPLPAPNGNLELVDGVAVYVQADPGVVRYWSHFATCPVGEKHRKPKPPRRQRQAPAALWDEHIAEQADPDGGRP